jgi:hypothetical protein
LTAYQTLYDSSETTRQHLVQAMLGSPQNLQDPNVAMLGMQALQQIGQMDRSAGSDPSYLQALSVMRAASRSLQPQATPQGYDNRFNPQGNGYPIQPADTTGTQYVPQQPGQPQFAPQQPGRPQFAPGDAGAGQYQVPGAAPQATGDGGISTAANAVQNASQVLDYVSKNLQPNQPLPKQVSDQFQADIQACARLGSVDLAKAIAARELGLQNQLQQRGWTAAMEQQFQQMNGALQQSMSGMQNQQELAAAQILLTGNPSDQNQANQMRQAYQLLAQMAQGQGGAAKDPAALAFLQAYTSMGQLASQNPLIGMRQQAGQQIQQLEMLKSAKGITETMYAMALANSGDSGTAKQVMQDALSDRNLTNVFPQAAALARQLGLGDQTGLPGQPGQPGQIPQSGNAILASLQQAQAILSDKNGTSADRFHKAQPLLDQAYNAVHNDQTIQQAVQNALNIQRQASSPDVAKNPAAMQQLQQQMQQLLPQLQMASVPAIMTAVAYNHYAVENPNAPDAAAANQHAIALLQEVQRIPQVGQSFGIMGALQQAQKHPPQAIDQNIATGLGATSVASQAVSGMLGPGGGSDPYSVITMPLVNKIPASIPIIGAFGAGRYDGARDQGAMVLAQGYQQAPQATGNAVSDWINEHKSGAVNTVGNLASGWVGLETATAVGSKLLADAPGWLRIPGMIAAGYATTLVTKEGIDALGHATLGTQMNTLGDNAWQSAFSFGAFYAMNGVSKWQTSMAEGSTSAEALAGRFPGIEKDIAGYADMTNAQQMAALRSQLATNLETKAALTPRIEAFNATRSPAEWLSSNPANWTEAQIAELTAGKGAISAEELARIQANPSILNTGITSGGKWGAYFKPTNWFRGNTGIANAESIADMNARANIMAFRGNAALGATFSGIYGAQNHMPWMINPATGQAYGIMGSLIDTAKDSATGGATAGTLPFLFKMPPLNWMSNGASWVASKIGPGATSEVTATVDGAAPAAASGAASDTVVLNGAANPGAAAARTWGWRPTTWFPGTRASIASAANTAGDWAGPRIYNLSQPLVTSRFGAVAKPFFADAGMVALGTAKQWSGATSDWQQAGAMEDINARAKQLLAEAQRRAQQQQPGAPAKPPGS